ncbi:hypothetical protein N9095_00345 [bacterium]|nr:hypothetical protein [bacterium]
MTSVSAFNDMLEQFLTELMGTFPEEKSIKKYHAGFDVMRKSNPKKIVTEFMSAIGPVAQKIMNKDESILEDKLEILDELSIKKHWNGGISDNTKGAIWQYLQTLYMLGTTITAIPADTLNMIEDVAKQCADKMQSGDGNGGEIDQAGLMNAMSGLFGNMMNKQ